MASGLVLRGEFDHGPQQRIEHVRLALEELGLSARRVEARRARFIVDENLERGTVLLAPRVAIRR